MPNHSVGNLSVLHKAGGHHADGGGPTTEVFASMINHSPLKSEGGNNQQFKRPPLPSIHLTSQKYLNTGRTFEFLKRKVER